jgi:hypothetical protein
VTLHEQLGAILADELLGDDGAGLHVLESTRSLDEELLEVTLGADDEDEAGLVGLLEQLASLAQSTHLDLHRLKVTWSWASEQSSKAARTKQDSNELTLANCPSESPLRSTRMHSGSPPFGRLAIVLSSTHFIRAASWSTSM